MNSINPVSVGGMAPINLDSMDLEAALMYVQTQRANLLEAQLRDQLKAVQERNQMIAALNEILAAVRAQRPSGKPDSKGNTGNYGGQIQVPTMATSYGGLSATELAKLNNDLSALLAEQQRRAAGGTGAGDATGGTGATDTLITVPSTVKYPPTTNPALTPYSGALNDLIDQNGRSRTSQDWSAFAGGNSQSLTGFVDYYNANRAVIDARNDGDLGLGYNEYSDQGDIGRALANNPNLRAEYEAYLRLSIQGGGTALPPNTPILAPAGSTAGSTAGSGAGGTNGGAAAVDGVVLANMTDAQLAAAIADKQTQIQDGMGGQSTGTQSMSYTSMSLNDALAAFGFEPRGKITQTQFDQLIATITSRVDGLNSTQQLDMLRLQSLSNKRNESFEIMTNFMKKIADMNSSILANLR